MTDLDAVGAALAARPTRVLYAETIANPTTFVSDHAALAELAHRHGATYIVDNTFASPYVCRPLELGADLVVESATKFLGGHSDLIAGVVAGPKALVAEVERVQIETGATLGPLEAFLVLRGILTLAVRAERHSRSAAALAGWLERQDGVRSVLYPGLPSHPQHAVAQRQFRAGAAGGMLAFEVEGGREAGRAMIDHLSLPELTASLGSVHTMVVHPPSTSQRQLTEAQLLEAGITPGPAAGLGGARGRRGPRRRTSARPSPRRARPCQARRLPAARRPATRRRPRPSSRSPTSRRRRSSRPPRPVPSVRTRSPASGWGCGAC